MFLSQTVPLLLILTVPFFKQIVNEFTDQSMNSCAFEVLPTYIHLDDMSLYCCDLFHLGAEHSVVYFIMILMYIMLPLTLLLETTFRFPFQRACI
jgi:hypothetical protein